MHSGFDAPVMPAAKAAPTFPQYAEFETNKKNEDALPQMPSWEGAEKKKVFLEEEEAVEMNALKKPEAGGPTAAGAMGGAAAAIAMSPNASRSPANRSPYGPPGADNDPYARGAPAYNQPGMAYSEPEQRFEMAGSAMGPGRQSPHTYNAGGYNGGYDDGGFGQAHDYPGQAGQGNYDNYGGAARQPYDNYDNYGSQANQGYAISRHQSPAIEMDATPSYPQDSRRSPAPQAAYGAYGSDSRRSPAPQGQYGAYGADSRRSPAPQGGDYASPGGYTQDARRSPAPSSPGGYGSRPYPPRQYSSDSTQPLRAPPQRQYSANNDMTSRGNTASPGPLRNETGFDFTSGYSRPPAVASPVHTAGGYRQPSPAVELGQYGEQQQYPGYKPYQHGA